jgi:hypothetical protein
VVPVLLWTARLVVPLPLLGIVAGFRILAAKFVFVAIMVCVAIWVFRRSSRRDGTVG